MKIALDLGHGVNPDFGAQGIESEESLISQVADKLVSLLAQNHEILLTRPRQADSVTDSLRQRVNFSNRSQAQLFLSVHFNCFNGKAHGCETFAITKAAKSFAVPIQRNLSALGFFDRGVKDGSNLYVLKHTNMPAVLVECCFCDSQQDMKIFDALKVAKAIALGIEEAKA